MSLSRGGTCRSLVANCLRTRVDVENFSRWLPTLFLPRRVSLTFTQKIQGNRLSPMPFTLARLGPSLFSEGKTCSVAFWPCVRRRGLRVASTHAALLKWHPAPNIPGGNVENGRRSSAAAPPDRVPKKHSPMGFRKLRQHQALRLPYTAQIKCLRSPETPLPALLLGTHTQRQRTCLPTENSEETDLASNLSAV